MFGANRPGGASTRGVGDWHDRLRPGVARRIAGYTKAWEAVSKRVPGAAPVLRPVAAAKAAVQGATPLSQNAYKVQIARTAVKRAILKAAGLLPENL